MGFDLDRLDDDGKKLVGERECIRLLVLSELLKHGELIAAEPRHDVSIAHRALEPPRDLLEQRVADDVSERVVDLLETIEIEEMHGEPIAVPTALLHGRFKLAQEQDPIGEVGQSVAMREMPDPRLGTPLRRDVLVDRNRSPVRHRPAAYGEDASVAQVVDDVAGLRQKRLPEAVQDIFLGVLRGRAGCDASLEDGAKRGPGLRLLGARDRTFHRRARWTG